ncbi:ATP-binding protein [Stigmatella aurantiaca]|uniref:histidine kinase n=1 Tax=Stigmatella aurantiaca (strain DW4/3-1) TaxID=378806 RepID=Q08VD2_STIAD|nr:ATP-binding protein [Stigmatella aurantiaca]ADO70960.1 Sensor protein [Stigmatella aurantiaca DW4/3-1]EAU64439.1 multi-sensor Hybrid Histidine Kinase [Stigmatella aurantiaca DW4/3-1]
MSGKVMDEVVAGGGEMGERIRAMDWAGTPLGPVEHWPQSLRSALSICLGSSFPIALYWGQSFALLYNDAWSPIAGSKHPWVLGRGAEEVWPEIWDTLHPLLEKVIRAGEATYAEDSLLPMHRHGYTEECYFNFTLSPIRGENGRVEGTFNAVIETTYRVISERRTQVLRELGERTAMARSAEQACALAASALGASPADAPFCALYLVDAPVQGARLAGCAGIAAGSPAAPEFISLQEGAVPLWPLDEVRRTGRLLTVTGLVERLGVALSGGPWPEPVHSALVVPLMVGSDGHASGFLILGTSPRRAIDEEYKQFAERVAANVSSVVGRAIAYEAERKRAEALAEIDRAKTAFFSNVSHEFRTPLTLMIGPTEDALASPERALRGSELERVYRNEVRLLRLVNTLLDFSRIEAGRVQATYAPVDLSRLTGELASTFRSAVERAGLRLRLELPPLPERIYVDHDMWEKIVLNLLSNALKFTFEGEIAVVLRWLGTHVELTIQDTGTGIPAGELPRIFDRFHRVQGARSRTHEGSGIGLSLVQELVKFHGGTIRAESTLGQGTAFILSLPTGSAHLPPERLGESGAQASAVTGAMPFVDEAWRWVSEVPGEKAGETALDIALPVAPSSGGGADAKVRILLADDNADMREYVARLLSPRWTVEAVADGAAALDVALARPPDLVLTDVMMPRLDGFGLLRALRSQASTRAIPVIMLSARAGEEARVEGMEAGADDYLVKPFSARELLARVSARLEISRMRMANAAEVLRLNQDLERRVRERTAQLEESNRELESFSYSVSHDLRAPLRHILGFAGLLEKSSRGKLDEKSQSHLRVIAEAAQKGGQLVDDLLAFSRLGRAEVKKRPVELRKLVEEVRAELVTEAEGRKVSWHVAPLPQVQADPSLLRLVLKNLLSNALKYTRPRAEAAIDVSTRQNDGAVEVCIKDNGVGFEMQYVGKLFGVFQRLHTPEQFEGTGIGLANVRRIILRHGGRVWAEGAVGEGAAFHFTLPQPPRSGGPEHDPHPDR